MPIFLLRAGLLHTQSLRSPVAQGVGFTPVSETSKQFRFGPWPFN